MGSSKIKSAIYLKGGVTPSHRGSGGVARTSFTPTERVAGSDDICARLAKHDRKPPENRDFEHGQNIYYMG